MLTRTIVPLDTQTVLLPQIPSGTFQGWGIRIG
jgi:hypothetical protein